MPTLPTVHIDNPDKPGEGLIINQEDFDPALHTLFGTQPVQEVEEVEEVEEPQPKTGTAKRRR